MVSGLAEEGEPVTPSEHIAYCMDEEADGVLSTNITDDERKVYETVTSKLDGF